MNLQNARVVRGVVKELLQEVQVLNSVIEAEEHHESVREQEVKDSIIPNLYTDTGQYNKIFAILGEVWKQLPIIQRNLLIVIARNFVKYGDGDGDSGTPFSTNEQTTAELPTFFSSNTPAIAKILDALVAEMREEGEF